MKRGTGRKPASPFSLKSSERQGVNSPMPHETSLIATIVAGVSLSFIFGLIVSRIGLPPILGYLLAGFAIGPFTPGYVADSAAAHQLSEIGVTLLMFGVGLHFSIKDLWSVRRVAVPGAVVQIATATLLGVGAAHLWGMSLGTGIVFGLCLSVASTVVLIRAMRSRGQLETANGRIAVGWLIVEDLVTVLALVMLPALSGFLGGVKASDASQPVLLTLVITLIKVAAFVALMMILGKKLLPAILGGVARLKSKELFTIGVVAIALGIAFGSSALFGVSPALGAFFAGVVIAESDLSYQAGAEIKPLQDTFTVLFFVAVGMLFEPSVIVRYPIELLATLGIVMVGKSIAAAVIVLLLRYPIGAALTISASLAQIGEFSFILGGLGLKLELISSDLLSIILAVGVLSIALNPLMFAAMDRVSASIKHKPRLQRFLENPKASLFLDESDGPEPMSGHVVMVGFGRVGALIGTALEREEVPYVVVDMDRQIVDAQKVRGIPTVFGDAARPGILNHAHLPHAKLLIIATPANSQSREIVQAARSISPDLPICVRSHRASDVIYFASQRIERVVLGELETALEMAGFALQTTLEDVERVPQIVNELREEGPALMEMKRKKA